MGQRRAELGGNGRWEESSWFGGQRVRDRVMEILALLDLF
jgi:hypothetical protein